MSDSATITELREIVAAWKPSLYFRHMVDNTESKNVTATFTRGEMQAMLRVFDELPHLLDVVDALSRAVNTAVPQVTLPKSWDAYSNFMSNGTFGGKKRQVVALDEVVQAIRAAGCGIRETNE
jgi:hypothetical protein